MFVHHIECGAFALTADCIHSVATRHSMQKQQVLDGLSDGVLNFTDAVQRCVVVGSPRNWRLSVQLARPVNLSVPATTTTARPSDCDKK